MEKMPLPPTFKIMNRKYLWVITFLLVLALFGGIYAFATKEKSPTVSATINAVVETKLIITDEKIGTGDEAVSGKTITVNYIGTLADGTKFDSSYDRNQPFIFNLGAGEVIAGWDQGLTGMKVGGKRKLTIPPSLGYGSQANGAIPPNSTLIFEVELLKVE